MFDGGEVGGVGVGNIRIDCSGGQEVGDMRPDQRTSKTAGKQETEWRETDRTASKAWMPRIGVGLYKKSRV